MELIQSGEAEVAVAVSGSRIVGSGYANIVQAKPYQAFHQYAHLGFMYVLPDFRGQGVNRIILEYLIEWANQKGIHEIQLEVYAENTIALKAYRRYGFAPSVLQMRLDTCRRANDNPDT